MSLREEQQMNLDTESATHTGMEGQSRCSHKYLLLQVWCGLLTVAMVVMAALLTSIKPKSTETPLTKTVILPQRPQELLVYSCLRCTLLSFNASQCFSKPGALTMDKYIRQPNFTVLDYQGEVLTLKPDGSPTVGTIRDSFKSIGCSRSYIQLIRSLDKSSTPDLRSQSCSLDLRDGSIYFTQGGHYFIYAQVTFSRYNKKNQTKSVILKRNPVEGKRMKILVEGTFADITDSSVWVAKIVSLTEEDSVSLEIKGDFREDGTFWGAYQLQ